MSVLFNVFCVVSGIAGALALVAGAMFCAGWSVVQCFKMAKVWHVICLALSVRLHGKDFADQQFWWAIKERASKSYGGARIIAEYAQRHAKQNPEEPTP